MKKRTLTVTPLSVKQSIQNLRYAQESLQLRSSELKPRVTGSHTLIQLGIVHVNGPQVEESLSLLPWDTISHVPLR